MSVQGQRDREAGRNSHDREHEQLFQRLADVVSGLTVRSQPVELPDFTRGNWNNRNRSRFMEPEHAKTG